MLIQANKYNQNSQEFISFNIEFEDLHRISRVLIYEQDPDGYQRKPNIQHINKLKKYILSDSKFLLPTSIILGVDKDDIEGHIKTENDTDYIDVKNIPDGMFRVVDGQHRIKGLAKAISESLSERQTELKKFTFNIVCIITDKHTRSKELQIFVDINSKGKKVSTDLAELAKYNYQIIEQQVENNSNSIAEHVAMKVARELREKSVNSVWNYAIKFDIHSKLNIGIVGVSSFRKSITRTIQLLNEQLYPELKEITGQELIDKCNEIAEVYRDFYIKCWDKVVVEKWMGCFEQRQLLDEYENFVSVWYSKDHYIQKALGVKSINKIIEEVASDNKDQGMEIIQTEFEKVINESNVKNEDWKIGETFAGLNSESGFKKIRQMIRNEINISRD